ncbi:MAG: TVP38/TMEM64 family protein [Ruminiclostridium sp.]|jgi:uncharacterized membrane protein YdjX (TVP38/TMEM64 family)|nr:TVP38/TMEM64 family protein [Ruminiclostridium sp.]
MQERKERTLKQRRWLAIGILAAVLVASALIIWKVGVPMLRLASEPEAFRQWIEQRGLAGRFLYVGMVFLQVMVAIIPGEPLEIVGGCAFGTVEGMLLCLLGGMLGSIVVIILVRRYGMRLVSLFFSQEKLQSIRFLKSSPRRTFLFLVIFTIPGSPKDLLCYFAGLTDISLPALFVICALGRIPSVVTSTIVGDALGTSQYIMAVVVFVVTLAVSCVGLLLYQKICKSHNHAQEE